MRSLRLVYLAAGALLLAACTSGGAFKSEGSPADAGVDPGANVAPPLDIVLADGQTLPDWLQASCDAQYVGTGVKEGDIAYDFVQTDQHGQDLRLHDFCDHVVLLIGSAFW